MTKGLRVIFKLIALLHFSPNTIVFAYPDRCDDLTGECTLIDSTSLSGGL